VFPGGVAVLLAIFKNLGIEQMQVSYEALREGLIYDMIGRIRHEDTRERTINALAERYNVDQTQAQRVNQTAQALLHQVIKAWQLNDPNYPAMLSWAAQIHEIGLAVSHSQFHKHGAYLIENADLSGFSKQEQRVLAALIRGHRRKFPSGVFEALPSDLVLCAKQICLLLRLAVLLHRSRLPGATPLSLLEAQGNRLELEFPQGWLEQHPLTQLELAQEAEYLTAAGFDLKFH
jgi:exopolyphosphatase/guanosine-5'-triphosphate,3'-diphosphate pyrophosphatase